jgi:hypothetical protein
MFEYLNSVTLAELVQQQRPGHTVILHDERPQRRVVRRSEALAA